MNKRTVYNAIMKSVSTEVKKALNESENKQTPAEKAADKLEAELKKYKKDLSLSIDLMKIMAAGTTNITDYSSRNFKEMKYEGVTYAKLIPELEKRLKKK